MLDYEYTWKDKMAELDEQVKDLMDKEEFAKGGEVKKKENNSMLIGGLAGILLGIFLGRR